MAPTNANPHEELKTATSRLIGSNRFILGFLGFSMLFMFVLGPWIYFIAIGLLWGFWIICMTFNSPYQRIIRIFRLEGLPEHLPKPDASTMISNLAILVVPSFLVYLGIRLLVSFGFDLYSPMLAIVDAVPFVLSD